MTCAKYGVAVSTISRGRLTRSQLVCSPMYGDWHWISAGDEKYARELQERMFRSNHRYSLGTLCVAYTVVPLPMTGE